MAAIVNTALAGATVTYNGFQFGGSDSAYTMTPPIYGFRGQFRYDETGRAISGTDYILTVRTIIFGTTEGQMAAGMNAAKRLLAVPGKLLTIAGIGIGFGTITTDLMNGPKPLGIECTAIGGQLAWELSWSVGFFVAECLDSSVQLLAFMAFNFDTTWQNDFEGITQRTIAGHVLIPQNRDALTPKSLKAVAEQTRGNIFVVCPFGFQRTSNVWKESADKQRLDFVIVDEQLPGDVLPPGISDGDGEIGFTAGDGKGGFANGHVTMSMSLKTAPNQPRELAGQVFLIAAIAKQGQMQAANPGGTVIPARLSISAGKYKRARVTNASMSWNLTKCLNTMLTAAGIWTPLTANNYQLWRASMDVLWNNRGTSLIGSNVNDGVIIDLCDNVSQLSIGDTPSNTLALQAQTTPALLCPQIGPDGGWLRYDLKVRVHRTENSSLHRAALSYLPSVGQSNSGNLGLSPYGSSSSGTTFGGTNSQTPQDVVEYHGQPETLIGLSFIGLRAGPRDTHAPVMPQLTSVGGLPAYPVSDQEPGPARWAFDVFGCPVWVLEGYRIYRVNGYVASTVPMGSKASCGAPETPTDL